MQIIFGIHAVEEALAARGRGFDYVAVVPGAAMPHPEDYPTLPEAGVPLRSIPRDQLTRLAKRQPPGCCGRYGGKEI